MLTDDQIEAVRRHFALSPRQTQLVCLILEGVESNEALAQRLDLSVWTVKVYLRHLYGKLGVNSKLSLALKVMERIPPAT